MGECYDRGVFLGEAKRHWHSPFIGKRELFIGQKSKREARGREKKEKVPNMGRSFGNRCRLSPIEDWGPGSQPQKTARCGTESAVPWVGKR